MQVTKIASYIPVSCCALTDTTGENHCTHPPLPGSEKREAERVAEMQGMRERHAMLMKFADSPVVTALLEQHAPHEANSWDRSAPLECHGCPQSHDSEYGESYQEWPCPTWQTISDESS